MEESTLQRDVHRIKQILTFFLVITCAFIVLWVVRDGIRMADASQRDAAAAEASKKAMHESAVEGCKSLLPNLADPAVFQATHEDVEFLCKEAGVDISADLAKYSQAAAKHRK